MSCQIYPSQMCPGKAYKNCKLNIMNFWEVICIYYFALQGSFLGILVNLPILVTTLPLLPPALFFYLMYLFALPLKDIFNIFFPSLDPILIPILIFFLVGVSRARLSKVFKWR
ncbi:hypothetical protein [Acidianus bottle-shaped virus]|uniref:Putative transmembrane protein ORF112 n=1 Tax=Acidianus bottle-shaped virus (isolate Italy/Pozzuoli) TaxID=654911 RepID=Y112_ABVP|nr:hypothetical protein ABV_gp43 [Acidianus bottle-shaped virus]A4ZUC9.1 RecName: Full=Putative transmembrane protein ORF112 [Acidianus bottle-shaped virus (isolate Pozzuoli)]ABP73433.1 hypothetical protein [Acidianus bottle-shaped virus]